MSKAQVIHKLGPPSAMQWEDWPVPDPGPGDRVAYGIPPPGSHEPDRHQGADLRHRRHGAGLAHRLAASKHTSISIFWNQSL